MTVQRGRDQPCRNGCGATIYLSNRTGKWLPYNLDDSQHFCQTQGTARATTTATTRTTQPGISQEQYNELKLKLEAIDKKLMTMAEAIDKLVAMQEMS